jgi:class 3 adenylate cyclase
MVVCQLLVVFLLVGWLTWRASALKRPLSLLTFCDPHVVLETPLAIQLLRYNRAQSGGPDRADCSQNVIRMLDQGCVLCDRNLVIEDSNDLFANFLAQDRYALRGQSLITAMSGHGADQVGVLDPLLTRIEAALKGKGATVFSHGMSLKSSNEDRLLKFHVMCLADRGTAMGMDAASITGIALLMEHLTQNRVRLDDLKTQQDSLVGMLSKVIPEEVLGQLEEGAETVTFAVQSASIGFVSVKYRGEGLVQVEFADRLQFYDDVFHVFDRILADYKLLARIAATENVYMFAGGLFGSVNRPEKHAEEATRFAVQLIQERAQIEAEAGSAVELTIGLNTGGPLVAAIPTIRHTAFQLVGPPCEIAEQLMRFGVPMQVHVTRSVYELVYAKSFRITDRGEVKVDGDRMIATYLIDVPTEP